MGIPLRVLIVEDSEDDAVLILRELQRGGFEPAWERVETSDTMGRALESGDWDVVLSDHSLPRFGAPQALDLLKQRGLDLPFIIVSGSIGEEAAVEGMKAGARDYVLKGQLTKLPAAVRREIGQSDLRRAHAESERSLRETRARLDAATQQLVQAEKLTALGELVAGVAHEMNNPLSSIMGYTQLLLARDLGSDVRRRLETVLTEAERLAKIVKNLLAFARQHPPEKKLLGLNGIIEKTVELKAYHFRSNQVRVEFDLAPGLPMTMLDFHQIQQVLINLLNNAEQAMAEAGRGGTIRLSTRAAAGRIEARVTDSGPGVPLEIQRRIFEPFFTTKKEGKGTGLGLSLCYGILKEHGGTIRVESNSGEGATFVINLPIVHDAPVAAEARPSASAGAVEPLKILVIDDEQSVQDLLVDLLTARGHRVDTASDVPEALQKIAANPYELLISDMKMPHGSGSDIYRAVLGMFPRLAPRIVFTTGDGAGAETRRFLEECGNETLPKPFKLEALDQAIGSALKR